MAITIKDIDLTLHPTPYFMTVLGPRKYKFFVMNYATGDPKSLPPRLTLSAS